MSSEHPTPPQAPEIHFLEPVKVRSVWAREDRDFTPWLAREEPLRRLLDKCGIEMGSEPVIQTEVRIPGILRSLDILVELEGEERIAIENQFAESDHDHLTRALAYAVGLEAKTVIVTAESHRPEFVAVARYLNDAGLAYEDHGIRMILVAVEVEGSPGSNVVHPKFEVIEAPNEWKAAVDVVSHGATSPRDAAVLEFHERILPFLRDSTGLFQHVSASKNQWKSGAVGIRGVSVTYGPRKDSTFVQIWFSRTNSAASNRAGIEVLEEHTREVESALADYALNWRKRGTTTVLEVVVDGIGYETAFQVDRANVVAAVAKKMVELLHRYRVEISTAMASATLEDSDDDLVVHG